MTTREEVMDNTEAIKPRRRTMIIHIVLAMEAYGWKEHVAWADLIEGRIVTRQEMVQVCSEPNQERVKDEIRRRRKVRRAQRQEERRR